MRAAAIAALAAAAVIGCGGERELVELTDGTANAGAHAIVFDGEAYAVVWTTRTSAGPDRLWFARVDPGGELLIPPDPVLDLDLELDDLIVTATAGGYVAWFRERGTSGAPLQALQIDARGDGLGTPTDLGAVAGAAPAAFAVTWAGDRYAVAAQRSEVGATLIRINTYGADLAARDSSLIETGTVEQLEPCIAWSAGEQRLIVVWRQQDRIRTARASADTTPSGVSTLIADLGEIQVLPALAAGADGVLAGWAEGKIDDHRQLRFAVGTAAGWRAVPPLVPDNRYADLFPIMVATGGVATIAWASDADTALPVIAVGRFDLAEGAELTDVTELTSARWGYGGPRLAAGTGEVGVVFTGEVEGATRLYFTAVD